MELRLIERGTRIIISVLGEEVNESKVYEATFYDMNDFVNETSFVAKCTDLNRDYDQYNKNTLLEINFSGGSNLYTFKGKIIGKIRNDSIVIEQTSTIVTLNRRKYQRDEIRVDVRLFPLSEDMVNNRRHTIPSDNPVMKEMSFDISAGGMCIVTNVSLNPKYDPYYLVEFALSEKDVFLLPAKLVRRSNYARSRVGKYDYGFQFIFTENSNEMSRLTKAILNKKLSPLR